MISFKDIMHPEIYDSPLPMEYKWALQTIMDNHFEGDFDKLLEGIETFCVKDESYEEAAVIRDYREFRKINQTINK